MAGHTTVAVGHSGVGKSTLVNALVPDANRAIGRVNTVTGRGRHTSSSTISYRVGDGWIIDTPGVRSFGLGHVNPDNILRSFTDLAAIAEDCPRGCTHLPDSPDCAIVERVEAGELGDDRQAAPRLAATAAHHARLIRPPVVGLRARSVSVRRFWVRRAIGCAEPPMVPGRPGSCSCDPPPATLEVVTDLQPDLQFARRLADEADALSMARFRATDLVVTTKPDLSPVSDADKAVEQAIRSAIGRDRPGDSVLGEEFGTVGQSRRQWIIDPIDGTKNYVRGVPVWATLIALAIDGVPQVGVVSAPALGKRWWAAKGSGAWMRDAVLGEDERGIHVSAVADLADASASCSGLSRWEEAGKLDNYLALSRTVWRTRDYGDMWPYMMVAEGRVDVAGELDLQVYDMAALVPIVEEAGGTFTSVTGEPGPWHHSAVATNGRLHDAVLAILALFLNSGAEPRRRGERDRPRARALQRLDQLRSVVLHAVDRLGDGIVSELVRDLEGRPGRASAPGRRCRDRRPASRRRRPRSGRPASGRALPRGRRGRPW